MSTDQLECWMRDSSKISARTLLLRFLFNFQAEFFRLHHKLGSKESFGQRCKSMFIKINYCLFLWTKTLKATMKFLDGVHILRAIRFSIMQTKRLTVLLLKANRSVTASTVLPSTKISENMTL